MPGFNFGNGTRRLKEMNRYSASYVYKQSNFAIIGFDGSVDTRSEWYDLASVALNVIQRGTPTPAPERLVKLLGSIPESLKGSKRPVRRVVTHEPRWDMTIKGAPNGGPNPAKRFYQELLPGALPKGRRFIMGYILPEALISDIIDECDPRFVDQRVDFYCPRARLAIEIDGSQHGFAAQTYLDIERDMYLRQSGIETIRIATSDLDASRAAEALVERFEFRSEPEPREPSFPQCHKVVALALVLC